MAFGINPSFDWQSFGGNALQDLGYGLSTAPSFGSALGVATQRNVTLSPERAKASKEKDQLNQSVALLQSKFPDLADYAQSTGDYQTAFGEMFKRLSPDTALDQKFKQAQIDALTAKQTPGLTEVSPGASLYDPVTGKPVFTAPTKPDTANVPAGYQTDPTDPSKLAFIPGGPADPSTAAKTTEATRRNQQLASVITPELTSLVGDGKSGGTFDALGDAGNQIWNGAGVGNFMASPQYQQAQNSLKTIVASYLYSVSGATANPGEVQNQVDVLTPKPGESKESVAAKKARLVQMVEAVKAAATGRPIDINNPGGAPNLNDPLGIR